MPPFGVCETDGERDVGVGEGVRADPSGGDAKGAATGASGAMPRGAVACEPAAASFPGDRRKGAERIEAEVGPTTSNNDDDDDEDEYEDVGRRKGAE